MILWPRRCFRRVSILRALSFLAVLSSMLAPALAQLSPAAIPAEALAGVDAADGPDRVALPDAPLPPEEGFSSSASDPASDISSMAADFAAWAGDGAAVTPGGPERVPLLRECPTDTTRARECRVHWRQLLISSAVFNAFQNAGNLYTGYWYRYETTHGPWFREWFDSVSQWHWDRWSDKNPFLDDYVGHPMMGAITNAFWIQNDPKGMTLEFSNSKEYWRSRLRATAFSAAYSFEWKFGPFGEAGIGHIGDDTVYNVTDQSGIVELVTTPVGGLFWTVAEDLLDKHLVRRIEEKPRRPVTLLLVSFLTPARATGNIFRFRPPWYRDDRTVRANTFWSDPPSPDDDSGVASVDSAAAAAPSSAEGAPAVEPVHARAALPVWPHYGGVHEFGAWWGLSLISGHIWGYAGDIKFMPIDVTYSYLFHEGRRWNVRYSPELTALALMDQPNPGSTNFLTQRTRAYGSGLSPVGFRTYFLPASRVQPYFSTNGGFIYFDQRVLSPQGSRYMYTIDFGTGLTIFRLQRQSISIGYRYQHMSNANISHHNPGTDANTFYVAISRYRTKGYR